jgi:hypothetical protein
MPFADAADELLDEEFWPDFSDERTFDFDDPMSDSDPTGFGGLLSLAGGGGGGDEATDSVRRQPRVRGRSLPSARRPSVPPVRALAPDVWMRK